MIEVQALRGRAVGAARDGGGDQIVLDAAGLGGVAKIRWAQAASQVVDLCNPEDLPAMPSEIQVRRATVGPG